MGARTGEGPDGILLLDKPAGISSHGVVSRVRRAAGTRRVGHAGTLDPMATGLLVLGVGRGTKLLTYLVGADKAYDATVRLGVGTLTEDAEGEVTASPGAPVPSTEELSRAVAGLTGEIEQVPSAVSAIKVDGKRAYARVRSGEDVVLASRRVTVSAFDVLSVREARVGDVPVADVDVRVEVSSGTYVRALARDLGAALGTAAHLTALRRTRVGPFDVADARTLEQLEASFALTDLATAARAAFPAREVTAEEAVRLSHGRRVASVGLGERPVGAFAPDGTLVALVSESGPQARPVLVVTPG